MAVDARRSSGVQPMIEAVVNIGGRLMHPRTRRARLLRDAARVAGFVLVVWTWQLLTFNDYQHDARAYWALDLDALYSRGQVGGVDAYLYSPAFAQAFTPLTWLPFGVFAGV